MAWSNTGCEVVQSISVSKSIIAQKEVDYTSPEGAFPKWRILGTVVFFGTTRHTVTTVRGLTYAAAKAMVDAAGATQSTWKESRKSIGPLTVGIPFESHSKTTSMRRADESGQYVVEIAESSTTTDGTEVGGAGG